MTNDPTDPGHDVEVLREHVRHLERHVRQLSNTASEENRVTTSNTGHGPIRALGLFLGMMQHQNTVSACKALAQDAIEALDELKAALSSASSGAGVLTEYRMFDSQWVNVVNDPSVMNADGADEAVEAAVRLTEKAMAKNIRDGNWPGGAILAATQRAEPVAQSGVTAETLARWNDTLGEIHDESLDGHHVNARTMLLAIAHEVGVEHRAALNAAPPAAAQKCDGNHGGPRCADPECWNDEPAPAADAEPVAWLAGWRREPVSEHTAFRRVPVGLVGRPDFVVTPLYTRPAAPLSEVSNPLGELIGSFEAAICEGLFEVLSETTDERLKDLVERRLLAGYRIAIGSSPSPQPTDEATDAGRLDWLDSQREAYGFQDIHEGNGWRVTGAYANVREAIDAEMRAARLATPPDNAAGREVVK